jgi:hypothetical protein
VGLFIPAILAGKRDDVGRQCRFILAGLWGLALGGSMLAENPSAAPLRDAKLANNMIHARPAASGAQ